jgi:molecular chaperone Hsp33
MSANQEVSVVAVVGTKVVADAVSRHKTAPTATAALGRTMLSALLLGVFKGDDETVQITFKGDGPIGTIMAISDNRGMVKGMCANPSADPPLRPDGKLNVGAAVGKCVPSHTGFHTTPFAR